MSTGSVQVIPSNVSPTKGSKSAGLTNQQTDKASGFQLLLNQLGMKANPQGSHGNVSKSDSKNSIKNVKDGTDKTIDEAMTNLLSLLQSLQQKLDALTHAWTPADGQPNSVTMQSLRQVLGSISTELQDLKGKQMANDTFKTIPSRLQELQQYVELIQNLLQNQPKQATINHQVNLVLKSIQDWMSLGQNSAKLFTGFRIASLADNFPTKTSDDGSKVGISQKIGSKILSTLNTVGMLNRKSSNQKVPESDSVNPDGSRTRVSYINMKSQGLQKSTDNDKAGSYHGDVQRMPFDSSISSLIAGNNGQMQMGAQTDIKIPAESFAQQFGQLLDSKGLTTQNALLQSTDNGQEFRIKLIPEGMGEIHVLIQSKDAGLSVQFAASSEQARQLLDAQSGQLREQLNARGIQLEQVQVTNLPNTSSFAFSQSDQQSRNWGNQQQKSKRIISSIDEQDMGFGSYLSNPGFMMDQNNPSESDQKSVIDTTA